MISPAATDSSSTYFKIGTTVTFSWSYTSVQVTPTAVDVEAYCAINKYILEFLKWANEDFIIRLRRIYRLIIRILSGIQLLMRRMPLSLF